jgi:hypothetical protein
MANQGPAVGFDAAVQQGRDVRVVEMREVVALAHERIDQVRRRHLGPHALQRDLLLVLAVGAAGFVDGAHAAGSDHAIDAPWPQAIADAGGRRIGIVFRRGFRQRIERNAFQRMPGGIRRQQPQQCVMERGFVRLQSLEGA